MKIENSIKQEISLIETVDNILKQSQDVYTEHNSL